MDVLDYLEAGAKEQMAVLRKDYDDLHDRAYKFATLLMAGGGAVGAYAFAEFAASPAKVLVWAPAAGLALTWFGTAAVLLWRGAAARDISAGPEMKSLQARYEAELALDGADETKALTALRKAALGVVPARVKKFSAACIARADHIDSAYKAASVCTPLVPIVIAVAIFFTRR